MQKMDQLNNDVYYTYSTLPMSMSEYHRVFTNLLHTSRLLRAQGVFGRGVTKVLVQNMWKWGRRKGMVTVAGCDLCHK